MNPLEHFDSILTVDPQVDLKQQFETDHHLTSLLTPSTLIVRAWPTQGVILGKLDTILPGFQEGLDYIKRQNWPVLIRKAGGLGVVCVEGVLNLTFLLSKHHPIYGGLHASYTLAVELLKAFIESYGITLEAKAVPQSYCPGDYDLSVKGQKIAGIAQFRSKEAVMVMTTMAISGDQDKRCALMRGFYDRANTQQDPMYPVIDSRVMSTLSKVSDQSLTVEDVWDRMMSLISSRE